MQKGSQAFRSQCVRLAWFLFAIVLTVPLQDSQAQAPAQQVPTIDDQNPTPPAKPDIVEIPIPGNEPPPKLSEPPIPELTIPNFASCTIAELKHMVPDLEHLKASDDQASLIPLLDKIGAKTVEVAEKTPNLISHESVFTEVAGSLKTHKDYSYLVVQHAMAPGSKGLVLYEYRVDVATGKKFESEEFDQDPNAKSLATSSSTLGLPSARDAMPDLDSAPHAQGFVNDWLHFYPSNRRESDFRYLGQQKMDGHHTLVVAFAQKAGSVRFPSLVQFEDKRYPILTQGIAWVDASDFRIIRLRTDLLSAPPRVPLRQLTADIHFSEFRIAEASSPLWLPYQVAVVTKVGTISASEKHHYSEYRLFRAHSKIKLTP
jgi:hypothetical protein